MLHDDEVASEIERFYEAARASLAAVWPAVQALAKALLKHGELSVDGIFESIQGTEIYRPVLAVQEKRGLRFNMVSGICALEALPT